MLWQKITKIESTAEKANTDLADFKLHVAKEHPTQENFTRAVDGFNNTLKDVFGAVNGIKNDIKTMSDVFRDKLEQKADRHNN